MYMTNGIVDCPETIKQDNPDFFASIMTSVTVFMEMVKNEIEYRLMPYEDKRKIRNLLSRRTPNFAEYEVIKSWLNLSNYKGKKIAESIILSEFIDYNFDLAYDIIAYFKIDKETFNRLKKEAIEYCKWANFDYKKIERLEYYSI